MMVAGVLGLPPSAERLIELHEALKLVAAILRQSELRVEQRSLVVEDFEIGGDAASIALQRSVHGVGEIFHGDFLCDANFVILLVGNQGVGDVAESELDSLLIGDQKLPLL